MIDIFLVDNDDAVSDLDDYLSNLPTLPEVLQSFVGLVQPKR